jgi:exodeoxyribonuclease-3
MTTIISWNVNGIRSNILSSPGEKYTGKVNKNGAAPFHIAHDSNFVSMVNQYNPDIVCLQETRCDVNIFNAIIDESTDLQYRYVNCSTNPARGRGSGYSGTAIFSKIKPISIFNGVPTLSTPDIEGRCITAEYEKFYVVNVYTPNSGSNIDYRLKQWDFAMLAYLLQLRDTNKDVFFTGDMNVCREEIDVYSGYPPLSKRIAGLLPEEIYNMNQYQEIGFIDTFRHINPHEDSGFTWWNPRIKIHRELNYGWRIDYGLVSDISKCVDSQIASEVMGSDHCPIVITMNYN